MRSGPRILLAWAAAWAAGALVGAGAVRLLWWTEPGPAWAPVLLASMALLGAVGVRVGLGATASGVGAWSGALASFHLSPDSGGLLRDPVVLLVMGSLYLGLFLAPVLVGGWLARRRGGRPRSGERGETHPPHRGP